MKKGFLYNIFNYLLTNLKYYNLVELFKHISSTYIFSDRITGLRFGVDVFILIKWVFVITIWVLGYSNRVVTILMWYLIFMNIYTYFYYHVWHEKLADANFSLDRIKRRFLNLMLAIAFNIISFAYLFVVPYQENFEWKNPTNMNFDSICLSLSNALISDYQQVLFSNHFGERLMLIETLISFIFLTIILSNSIPQTNDD